MTRKPVDLTAQVMYQVARWIALDDLGCPLKLIKAYYGTGFSTRILYLHVYCVGCGCFARAFIRMTPRISAPFVHLWKNPLSDLIREGCLDALMIKDNSWPLLSQHATAATLSLMALSLPYHKPLKD